jgi:hypothetical protein
MKNGLVIADSGSIFSLALIDKLNILNDLFNDETKDNCTVFDPALPRSHSVYGVGFLFPKGVRSEKSLRL